MSQLRTQGNARRPRRFLWLSDQETDWHHRCGRGLSASTSRGISRKFDNSPAEIPTFPANSGISEVFSYIRLIRILVLVGD